MKLTGIYRGSSFSPNQHGLNDRLILEKTAGDLRRMGCQLTLMREEDVGERPITNDVVFSMCQGPGANDQLEPLEQQGKLIINSPAAVKRCYRQNLYQAPGGFGSLLPHTTLVATDAPGDLGAIFEECKALWIKRGDVHSTQEGDVIKVDGLARCLEVLSLMHRRGIGTAALQRHVPGMVIKFYGVVGSDFFRFYAEQDHDLHPAAFPRSRPAIERLISRVGLQVYGGDAVLGEDGTVTVIDVNDWPSYAYFREEAAAAIAGRIFALALARARRQAPAALERGQPQTHRA